MYHPQKIESFDLPELQPYRTMRRQHEHRQQGIFVAEGEKVVSLFREHYNIPLVHVQAEKLFLDALAHTFGGRAGTFVAAGERSRELAPELETAGGWNQLLLAPGAAGGRYRHHHSRHERTHEREPGIVPREKNPRVPDGTDGGCQSQTLPSADGAGPA